MPIVACGPFLLLAAACSDDSTRPRGEDSRQLDNAAEMLDSADNELGSIDTAPVEDAPANGSDTAR